MGRVHVPAHGAFPPVRFVAAVGGARADVDVRHNGATLSLLAWCLHRGGRDEEALQAVD